MNEEINKIKEFLISIDFIDDDNFIYYNKKYNISVYLYNTYISIYLEDSYNYRINKDINTLKNLIKLLKINHNCLIRQYTINKILKNG